MRASDADRDEAIGALRERFAEGRLSHETFMGRIDAALHAKDHAELDGLFADLRPAEAGQAVRRRGIWWPAGHRHTYAGPPRGARAPWRLLQMTREVFAWLREPTGIRSGTAPERMCLPSELGGTFIIGREPACDFLLADLSVSRRHARLYHEDGRWLLADLGSTNGTRLNGWRVTKPVPVRPGDYISLGAVTMIIADRPPALGELGPARAAAG